MANGFLNVLKGKTNFRIGTFWRNGAPQDGAGSAVSYSTGGTQTLGIEPNSLITASSGLSVFTLGSLPYAGARKQLTFVSVSSGVMVKAATGSSFDPSTNLVMKSTVAGQVTLVGLSTTKWSIAGAYPGSTLASSILTMSAAT